MVLTTDARIAMVADRRQQLSGAIASVRLGRRVRPARRQGRRPDHLVPVPTPVPSVPAPAPVPAPADVPAPALPVPAAARAVVPCPDAQPSATGGLVAACHP